MHSSGLKQPAATSTTTKRQDPQSMVHSLYAKSWNKYPDDSCSQHEKTAYCLSSDFYVTFKFCQGYENLVLCELCKLSSRKVGMILLKQCLRKSI